MITNLPLDQIRDGGAQMRVAMSDDIIADYAEEMARGETFPPVDVFYDGEAYWLADGYHRVGASKSLGRSELAVIVHAGTKRDAILHGIGSNARHGLQRTQADKRRAVETLLKDEEWSKLSDRKIASQAKVDHKTVGKIRKEMAGGEFPNPVTPQRRSGEIPKTNVKPSGSMVTSFLSKLPISDLIDECRRRGLTVEADNVSV